MTRVIEISVICLFLLYIILDICDQPIETGHKDPRPNTLRGHLNPAFCTFQEYGEVSVIFLFFVDICDEPIEPGPCKAAIPSWGFDSDAGKCVEFTYGGCDGNHNRFETEEACKRTCHKSGEIERQTGRKTDRITERQILIKYTRTYKQICAQLDSRLRKREKRNTCALVRQTDRQTHTRTHTFKQIPIHTKHTWFQNECEEK